MFGEVDWPDVEPIGHAKECILFLCWEVIEEFRAGRMTEGISTYNQ